MKACNMTYNNRNFIDGDRSQEFCSGKARLCTTNCDGDLLPKIDVNVKSAGPVYITRKKLAGSESKQLMGTFYLDDIQPDISFVE